MDGYQLGFTHACKLIKAESKKVKIPQEVIKLITFVENEEIKSIKRDIGF